MKKKSFNSKLNLKKESIANLNSPDMENVKGGNEITHTVIQPSMVLCTTDICASLARCTYYD